MAEEVAARLWVLLSMLAIAASFPTSAVNVGSYQPEFRRYGTSRNFKWYWFVPEARRPAVCVLRTLGVYGLFGEQSTDQKCGHDANLQTISCQPYCYGNVRKMEIFVIHDQTCNNVCSVVLTLNRINHSEQSNMVLVNTGSETMAIFTSTESRCPNNSYNIARLEPRMDQDWICDNAQYVYNATLYDADNETVTCPDDHISFHTRAPLIN